MNTDNTLPPTPAARGLRWAALALAATTSASFALAELGIPTDLPGPASMLRSYEAVAGAAGRADRGQAFFTRRHGGEWSCSSCHGQVPSATGRHAVTGKPINALAPAFNPKAFTDPRRTEKWFKRNCNDVVQRECTDAEKADVLAWLITIR
ncbi:DUF1924 domain-containing protein [Ideonella lacteola]